MELILRYSLAIVEMRLILARLIWNFDLELVDESEDWVHQRVFILWEKKGMGVKVLSRKA